jgi:truncated hemoglobin YjbI
MSQPPPPTKGKFSSREALKHLVSSVGGSENVKKIINSFYERMSKDLMIGFFFDGKDIQQIANKQAEFILSAAGLIEKFEGKSPSVAHVALAPILSGHFDRRLVILRETLVAEGLTPESIEAWVQFEEGFRAMIVGT